MKKIFYVAILLVLSFFSQTSLANNFFPSPTLTSLGLVPIGVSGNKIPVLSAANTWSTTQTFANGTLLPNSKGYQWTDVSGGIANFVLQGDNNLVLYGTNSTGNQYPIFGISQHIDNPSFNFNTTVKAPNLPSNPLQFGAKCNGSNDDTTALATWAASLNSNNPGQLPSGSCLTSQPISLPLVSHASIIGMGSGTSKIVYTGTSTTVDIFSLIGANNNQLTGWTFSGFTIDSRTRMTAGTALHFADLVRSNLYDVMAAGQDGSTNLWNGFWFDKVDQVNLDVYQSQAQNDGIRTNGGGQGVGPGSDLYITNGKIALCAVGLHIGGAMGGFHSIGGDIEFNTTNLLIDTALTSEGNRELFFDSTTGFDNSQTGDNVIINDTLMGTMGWIEFSGTWVASNTTTNKALVHIMPNFRGIFFWNGGSLFNSKADALLNESTLAQIHLSNLIVRANAGYGLNSTATPSDPSFLTGRGMIFIQDGSNYTSNFNIN